MTNQPTLFDVPPDPPSNATETSKAAGKCVLSKSKMDELTLLSWIIARGAHGATDFEIQVFFNWTGDYERPRRWRWSKNCDPPQIVNSGRKRRIPTTGNKAIVWVRV